MTQRSDNDDLSRIRTSLTELGVEMQHVREDVRRLELKVCGNGDVEHSMLTRLDRVEQWVGARKRCEWLVFGALFTTAIGALVAALTGRGS